MSAPYDDSTQKEWKERKGKIEGFYREMGQVGTPGKDKVSSIIVGKSGDKLVIQFEEGDGILYEIAEDMVSPLKMVKTVSQGEIIKFLGISYAQQSGLFAGIVSRMYIERFSGTEIGFLGRLYF